MALTYQLREGILHFFTAAEVEFQEGTNTLEAGLQAAAAAEPDTKWQLLFDIRESSENRSGPELHFIAMVIGEHRAILSGNCALVVAQPLHYGLGRMFGEYLKYYGMDTAVFHEIEAAERWLKERT
jgi:hypothetical protein